MYGYFSVNAGGGCGSGNSQGWYYFWSTPDWYISAYDYFGLMGGQCDSTMPAGYFGLTVTAPAAPGGGTNLFPAFADVSSATMMRIKLGNGCTTSTSGQSCFQGSDLVASAFTIVLTDGSNAGTPYGDQNLDRSVSNRCAVNLTLVPPGGFGLLISPSTPTNRLHSMYTYAIELSTFICSTGTLAGVLKNLTAVSIEVRSEFFTGTPPSAPVTFIEAPAISRISFGN